MGYQESFIHTTCSNVERNNSDIAKYIEMFKKYDVRCKGDWLARCVCKLHFNKTVSKYKKGMDVLVIAGERQAQRWAERLFDCDDEYSEKDKTSQYTKEELKLIKRAKITFIEEEWIVLEAEKDESLITVEKLNLLPELPGNYEEVNTVCQNILNKLSDYTKGIGLDFEDVRNYNPNNKEELNAVTNIFKDEIESCGYSFECKKEEETIDSGDIRYDYKMYINNQFLAKCCYLTWSDKYLFLPYNMTGQELRSLCKNLLLEGNGADC